MASQMGGSRAPDEDDDDDDVADLLDEEFLEHMEALKQACQMLPGAEVRLKSTSTLAASKFEEEGYEEEGDVDDDADDDALLLSIERKFLGKGGLESGPGRSKSAAAAVPAKERSNPKSTDNDPERPVVAKNGSGKGAIARHSVAPQTSSAVQPLRRSAPAHSNLSDDEDDDLLRSVKESCGALDLVKASKNVKTGLLKDSSLDRKFSAEERVPAFLDEETVPAGHDDGAKSLEEDTPHFPDVEDDLCEDVQSLEDVDRSAVNADAVDGLHGFLPGQLHDEEFDESPLPLVVHDPNVASYGAQAKVPENVHAVTEALLKNRLCQQTLRELLREVEGKLNENKEMQRRAVSLVEYQKACTRKFCGFTEVVNRSVELIATKPVSKKKTGEFKVKGPPENPDVEIFRNIQSQLPGEFNVKKWTKKETQALAKGVRQQLQEIRVRAMMEGWDSDEEGQDFDEQMRSIGESEEELKKGLPSVDWSEVARIYVTGRTPWECKLQWENNENPSLNNKPWTKAEDKKLLSIVQVHDMVEWAAIAEELGTERTPAQCAIRFQRSLNASILRSAWTPEEDQQLQAAVEKFGEKDWQAVAAGMEGRLGSQCMSRWTKVLHPDRHRRGRWLADEDTRLQWAVSVYGPRGWKNIAAHVPGRSDVQCRERWCNVLDPSVKIDDWSAEEDAKLESLVEKYGRHRWAAVGAELGRTDNQCFRHWKLLHPEHKISFKKDMAIRRAALATNFVGREKERPDLGFQDFLPPPGAGEEVDGRPLMLKGPKTSKPKAVAKPVRRAPKKRQTSEAPSVVNENGGASAGGGNQVPLLSSNGSSRRVPSKSGERATKKGKLTVPASADENVLTEEGIHNVEVASSNGDQEGPVKRLQVSSRKQPPKRVPKAPKVPRKTKTLEPAPAMIESLLNEKDLQGLRVASADGNVLAEEDVHYVEVASSNGDLEGLANSLHTSSKKQPTQPTKRVPKTPRAPKVPRKTKQPTQPTKRVTKTPRAPKVPRKTKNLEPAADLIENVSNEDLHCLQAISIDGSTELTNSANGSRKRRATQPGERASKKRKTPELPSVIVENGGDTPTESRDEKDAELIVYTRRKSRVSNGGKSSLTNSGSSELTTVGIEMSSAGHVERLDGLLDTIGVLLSEEPRLERHRTELMLPNFLCRDSLD